MSLLLLLSFALSLGFSSATATQILPRSVEELGAESSLLVEGRVLSQRSYWNEAGTRILTEIEVDVGRSYKGSGPALVRVVQMGGVVDAVRMTVSGALRWTPGEEVLLFLSPSLPGRYRVEGFSQGKFRIVRDRATGEVYATRSALGGVEGVAGREGSLRLPLERLVDRALQREGGR